MTIRTCQHFYITFYQFFKIMKAKPVFAVREYVYITLMTVLISVCSWITIPFIVPFTMQTFAVFCSFLFLGGKKGTASIVLYMFLGLIGLPVFSGFQGGFGHLIGPTGGYIFGFVLSGILYIALERLIKKKRTFRWMILALCLIVCYLTGTLWFMLVYTNRGISYGFIKILSLCVFPYIIPDCVKMLLAVSVYDRVGHYIPTVRN